MRNPDVHEIPFSRAVLWILLSTLLISGSALTCWLYLLHVREKRFHDEQYRIVAIIQSTSQADALKSAYLAEWLDLSFDRPVNLYQFRAKEAAHLLMEQPVIKSALVKKILPGALFIHYEMRTPIAYVGDFSNTAVDGAGVLFPFRPFFTPKRLPTFYLGLEQDTCRLGGSLRDAPSLQLAMAVLKQCAWFQHERMLVKQIDTSRAQADSCGQREIVVVLEEEEPSAMLTYLRLNVEGYAQGLARFRLLRRACLAEEEGEGEKQYRSCVVDLRMPQLGFMAHM